MMRRLVKKGFPKRAPDHRCWTILFWVADRFLCEARDRQVLCLIAWHPEQINNEVRYIPPNRLDSFARVKKLSKKYCYSVFVQSIVLFRIMNPIDRASLGLIVKRKPFKKKMPTVSTMEFRKKTCYFHVVVDKLGQRL